MSEMVVGRFAIFLAVLAISACGGEADSADPQTGKGGAPTNPEPPEPLAEPCYFPQPFPWFASGAGVSTSSFGEVPPDPPRGDGQGASHLFGSDALGPVNVNTHMHMFRFDKWADGLTFWARSELGPFELLFALTEILESNASYEADLAAGRPWPMKRVTISEEWQNFTFIFDELKSEGPGEPRVPNEWGSEFQMLLPTGAEYDLWLDDDLFVCTNTGCAGSCQP